MLPPSNSDAVNHMKRLVMTTEPQVEVGPVPLADLTTVELAHAKAPAQGNGVRVSLSYLLGGGNSAIRSSVPFCRLSLSPCHNYFRISVSYQA